MPDEQTLSAFDRFMMERQKTEQDLKNASFASNMSASQKMDMITWFLGCQSIHYDDLDKFYAFVSEEVKTANLDDRTFELCRCYRLQAMNYYIMEIPNRYHQNIAACPEEYVITATKSQNFRDTLVKTVQLLQLTKGMKGKYIDAMTMNRMSIHSTTPEEKKPGGIFSWFKR
jgi:hypothetical protein